jgi:2-hydroxycyclohexanecarboxyl-CoA dehydrogenase
VIVRGLDGKVALITGGAGGIGAALCRRFAQSGCPVAVFDIDKAGAQTVAEAIVASGGKAAAFRVDLTDQTSVNVAVAAAETALGPIDILVNNAGWDRAGNFLDTDKALWEKIVAVNLYGPLHMHHAVLRGMVARGAGRVINIASDAARVGSSGEAVYAFCKGGLVSFSKTMAREMARKQCCVPWADRHRAFPGFRRRR